jgi:hypothetical protein
MPFHQNSFAVRFFSSLHLVFITLIIAVWVGCQTDTTVIDEKPKDTIKTKSPMSPKDMALIRQGVSGFGKAPTNRPHDSLTEAEIAQLRHGDILLRRGYGMVSDFITSFLEEKYTVTHCGFVIRPNPTDSIMILHTVANDYSKGVLIEPLRDYIQNSQVPSLAAVRPKFSEQEKLLALEQAFDLLHRKIEFDMEFDDSDSSKLYCVEMVRNAYFRVVKKDILPQRISRVGITVTRMDNFFEPKYFEVLFNHCPPNF